MILFETTLAAHEKFGLDWQILLLEVSCWVSYKRGFPPKRVPPGALGRRCDLVDLVLIFA